MNAALIVGALLLGLPVVLLASPVEVAFRLEGIEAFNGQLTLSWLFGLVRFRIQLPVAGKPRPRAAPSGAKARGIPLGHRQSNVLAVLQQEGLRRRVWRLMRDLVGSLRVQELFLHLRLGLGDPADTGRLWAFVGPLVAMARKLRQVQLRIEPEFVDAVLEMHAHGRLVLIPLQCLALIIGFALSPASIHAWRTLRGDHA